jgi:hypothetical protein
MIFQEKHTTGFLWWKKVYYTYWNCVEGRVYQMPVMSLETINSLERGK